MSDITLSRGATSVTFKAFQESPGSPSVAVDVTKPFQNIRARSGDLPRVVDSWSVVEVLTLLGRLEGPTAYANARTLAEDLIRPHSAGTALMLDATSLDGFTEALEVGVLGQSPLQLNYRPGQRDLVDIQLSLPLVGDTVG